MDYLSLRNQQGLKYAKKMLLMQLSIISAIAFFTLYLGIKAAFAVILGGLVCAIPHICLAYKFFSTQDVRFAKKILKGFYIGQLIKFCMTTILFLVAFCWVKADIALVFLGYVGVLLISGLAQFFLKSENNDFKYRIY